MARTYEAFIKSEKSSTLTALPQNFKSHWPCADLLGTKEITSLAQKLAVEAKKRDAKVFNFVSSRNGEGTSTVVINLAKLMRDSNSFGEVLLIDANLQHPVLHSAFNLNATPGLREVLTKEAVPSNAIIRLASSNISVMPSGAHLATDLLATTEDKFSEFISSARNGYQYIMIDSPPLLTSSESISVAANSDVSFLVLQAHMTQWEVAEKAKNYLKEFNCTIGGVILNRVQQPIPDVIYNLL